MVPSFGKEGFFAVRRKGVVEKNILPQILFPAILSTCHSSVLTLSAWLGPSPLWLCSAVSTSST